mmetsp:Transcript_14461/g.41788  ORF Transcript_14461/g.41788 Transcript_14461/m.41788 type:complete len:212 (+) Transcript_14461:423-1058(+)
MWHADSIRGRDICRRRGCCRSLGLLLGGNGRWRRGCWDGRRRGLSGGNALTDLGRNLSPRHLDDRVHAARKVTIQQRVPLLWRRPALRLHQRLHPVLAGSGAAGAAHRDDPRPVPVRAERLLGPALAAPDDDDDVADELPHVLVQRSVAAEVPALGVAAGALAADDVEEPLRNIRRQALREGLLDASEAARAEDDVLADAALAETAGESSG